jgi:hypothetical protein
VHFQKIGPVLLGLLDVYPEQRLARQSENVLLEKPSIAARPASDKASLLPVTIEPQHAAEIEIGGIEVELESTLKCRLCARAVFAPQ